MIIDLFIMAIIVALIIWAKREFDKHEAMNADNDDFGDDYYCGTEWCDGINITPWKTQCSYEGTSKCGAESKYTGESMDKSKIAKMDMEAFRQLKDAENERDRWCNLAGVMHQYLVDGNPKGAVRAYEQEVWQ